MSTPDDQIEALRALVSSVMDGTADKAQCEELNELLRRDARARDEYLALVDMHAVLATELLAGPVTRAVEPKNSPGRNEPRSGRPRYSLLSIAALAASVLVTVTLLALREPESATFVSVAQLNQTVWDSDDVEVGKRLGGRTIRLQSGFVRLEYDSGVEVTLEGPAEFTLADIAHATLTSGLLTANVPPGAEGFAVKTPTAEVVDLGTSFGIDLREEGFSNVSVFDGEVEVAVHDREEKRLLSEGESVRIDAESGIEAVGFNTQPFEPLWPIASGISGSSENVRFVPPWPKRYRFVRNDDFIFVAPEGRSIRLSSPLSVNISEPGFYAALSDLTPSQLAEDLSVRSFFIHYAPVGQAGPRRADRIVGSITFDQPVMGLIVNHQELINSSRQFSKRGAGELNRRRELQLTGDLDGDRVSLSDDRKTVTLDLISPGRSSDLLRVIVQGRSPRRPPKIQRRRQR